MALNKPTLQSALENLFQSMTQENDSDAGFKKLAEGMANAFDAFVKSGTVTVATGIPVATSGSATSQTGATTGTGTGTIS